MLSAYLNCYKIPELRKRLLFTFGMVVLCRLVCFIPCPGVNPAELAKLLGSLGGAQGEGGLLDVMNMFSGGAIEKFAVGALGIMPYISASIILQLMTPVIPQLERMMREGESGRQKYNQMMRYVTLVICIIQGVLFATAMVKSGGDSAGGTKVAQMGIGFIIMTVISLTAGAMLVMWLGEMITERGIGNGASIIITVNIIARLPGALASLFKLVFSGTVTGDAQITPVHLVILLALFFLVTAGAIALTQGQRKIPVCYATRRVSSVGQSTSVQTSYLPLRVNYSGVMPIIFAGAILSFPTMFLRFLPNWPVVGWIASLFQHGSATYVTMYGIMILVFSFFWVANQFNPIKIADDLQKQSGYIPSIQPGNATAEFLDKSMTRITFAGAIFLTVLAVFPMILSNALDINPMIAQFFGGTSLLIIVGVGLDTLRQMESYLLARHYDGFMEKGKIKSRRG